MYKVKNYLQTIREIFIESSIYNLRFGGTMEYLEECSLQESDMHLFDKNKGDVPISTNQPRLILEETKLAIDKNVDAIKKKSTNEQVSKEKIINNTKREPVMIVSLIDHCKKTFTPNLIITKP